MKLQMTGFEPGSSNVRIDRSADCVTTTANDNFSK